MNITQKKYAVERAINMYKEKQDEIFKEHSKIFNKIRENQERADIKLSKIPLCEIFNLIKNNKIKTTKRYTKNSTTYQLEGFIMDAIESDSKILEKYLTAKEIDSLQIKLDYEDSEYYKVSIPLNLPNSSNIIMSDRYYPCISDHAQRAENLTNYLQKVIDHIMLSDSKEAMIILKKLEKASF